MWKVSSVVPIPKTATSTDNPSNYRPISLLPVVSKLLEKYIYSIVFEHLAERKLLSVDQWGFCPGVYIATGGFPLTCVRPSIVFHIYLSCRN